jgi:hypothetical protein
MPNITTKEYPQLSALCWSHNFDTIEESEALQLYESGWSFINKYQLSFSEHALITRLTMQYGNGVLNV